MFTTNFAHINTIIWDWNGTLLNDIDICIGAINELLEERNLELLSPQRYREVFTFPVKAYYEAIGFDFEKDDWDIVAHDFIQKYDQNLTAAGLFPRVQQVLASFQNHDFDQYMVSAMQHEFLEQTVNSLGIRDYFIQISGIMDHFASSKISMANDFVSKNKLNKHKTCIIGDTLHDFEVADSIGISCILIANGHQSFKRLERAGCPVLQSIDDLKTFFNLNGKQH